MNTLADLNRIVAEKSIKIEDSNITQYIKTAMELVEARGESLEDYALIKVQNPMVIKDDGSGVTITGQWRLIHVSKLENAPVYEP